MSGVEKALSDLIGSLKKPLPTRDLASDSVVGSFQKVLRAISVKDLKQFLESREAKHELVFVQLLELLFDNQHDPRKRSIFYFLCQQETGIELLLFLMTLRNIQEMLEQKGVSLSQRVLTKLIDGSNQERSALDYLCQSEKGWVLVLEMVKIRPTLSKKIQEHKEELFMFQNEPARARFIQEVASPLTYSEFQARYHLILTDLLHNQYLSGRQAKIAQELKGSHLGFFARRALLKEQREVQAEIIAREPPELLDFEDEATRLRRIREQALVVAKQLQEVPLQDYVRIEVALKQSNEVLEQLLIALLASEAGHLVFNKMIQYLLRTSQYQQQKYALFKGVLSRPCSDEAGSPSHFYKLCSSWGAKLVLTACWPSDKATKEEMITAAQTVVEELTRHFPPEEDTALAQLAVPEKSALLKDYVIDILYDELKRYSDRLAQTRQQLCQAICRVTSRLSVSPLLLLAHSEAGINILDQFALDPACAPLLKDSVALFAIPRKEVAGSQRSAFATLYDSEQGQRVLTSILGGTLSQELIFSHLSSRKEALERIRDNSESIKEELRAIHAALQEFCPDFMQDQRHQSAAAVFSSPSLGSKLGSLDPKLGTEMSNKRSEFDENPSA